MVLPPGVTKATGLQEALAELSLSKHNTVGIGDAENDHALLSYCECGVAVQNALPLLKERADLVTEAGHGAGVAELIDNIMTNDLVHVYGNGNGKVDRHRLLFGKRQDGKDVFLSPYGSVVLLAGPSGSGKSTVNLGVLEHLMHAGYQFCLIDPEGDYSQLHGAVVLGTPKRAPSFDEVLQVLREPSESVVVNLLGIPLADRPGYFQGLLPYIQELRARAGRPHWLVVDETHHLLPSTWEHGPELLPEVVGNMLMITVHPDQVSASVLSKVNVLVAVGKHPNDTMRSFAGAIGSSAPISPAEHLDQGQVLVWMRKEGMEPFLMSPSYAHGELRRHLRKYAEGDVGPKYFMFRGEDGRLHLRAQNLIVFMQMAEGVDDDTWMYHLRRGDYSRWFEDAIKDKSLAAAAAKVENDDDVSAEESRMRIKKAIEDRFGTLP
jgi:energy-coupling factor transporter ATP-binding protein EcfA2